MFASLKFWKLSSALKGRDSSDAYSAVLELGRSDHPRAVDLLIESLARLDGVSRAAARELGAMDNAKAVLPLIKLLPKREVNESASDALVRLGSKAVDALIASLESEDPLVRRQAAVALGQIGDKRAVEPLVKVLQGDDEYSVRTAATTALGQLKDARAIWVLVGTLKLRDESTPERRVALEILRQAANLAMRKIGDPLAARKGEAGGTGAETLQAMESALTESEVHPRLAGDVSILSEADLLAVMRELVVASEEVSWANLERRQPLLAHHFKTYDQRRQAAEMIGGELYRRGGSQLLRQTLTQLNDYPAIKNWWAAIGQ